MRTITKRPRPATATPVRVRNAACIRCDGPIYFDAVRWLHCSGACAARAEAARPIPYAPAARVGGAS